MSKKRERKLRVKKIQIFIFDMKFCFSRIFSLINVTYNQGSRKICWDCQAGKVVKLPKS